MIFNIVVDKSTKRVVEYGTASVDRFFTGENAGRYELHRGDVPQEFERNPRKLVCLGWDGEKVVDVGPLEGFDANGFAVNDEATAPTVDDQIASALEKQKQEFIEMFRKSGIKIS